MHESTAFDYYVEKGLEKGLAKGLAKGAITGARHILMRLAQKRFGPPDEATVKSLNEISDLDRLDRLSDAIFSASSWQELLATP